MKNRIFPINDVQFHEEGLRSLDPHEGDTDATTVLIAWHTTAIAYLQYGAFKKLEGPAAEREVNGRIVPALIEDNLILARDSHGQPYFKHTYKD